jgi:antitoxin VapB
MPKAKLFMTGGSQAVRLPAEFRFESDEVDIRRDPVTGDIVLSKPVASSDEFDWARALDLPTDALRERDQPQDDMRDLLRGAGVAEFLLDIDTASRRMRAERRAVTSLRRSGAKSVSISSQAVPNASAGAQEYLTS